MDVLYFISKKSLSPLTLLTIVVLSLDVLLLFTFGGPP